MMKNKLFYLLSYAAGIAGPHPFREKRAGEGTGNGPQAIHDSPYLKQMADKHQIRFHWEEKIAPALHDGVSIYQEVERMCTALAKQTSACVNQRQAFCVLGGDHSAAIGTWSGVYDAIQPKGELGLIWIDAHMDSHTPETSATGNIHGMPLASLLGQGSPGLTQILRAEPKLKPGNVCLIGIRSYEPEEAALLHRLNVRVYGMDAIKQRGLEAVMAEAIQHVSQATVAYGVTIDIDSMDPQDVPAVDVPEPDGIRSADLLRVVAQHAGDARWIATELVEFNPGNDQNEKTEQLMISLLEILATAK